MFLSSYVSVFLWISYGYLSIFLHFFCCQTDKQFLVMRNPLPGAVVSEDGIPESPTKHIYTIYNSVVTVIGRRITPNASSVPSLLAFQPHP